MNEYDRFAYYYDLYYTQVTTDRNFYFEIAELFDERPRILELACGSGRLMLPLLEAGYSVTGLDISEDMLRLAGAKVAKLSPEIAQRARLLHGDMRYPAEVLGGATFDLIILGFNSFQHLHSEAEQLDCLRAVRQLLASDGLFVIAMDNSDPDDQPDDKKMDYYGSFKDPLTQSVISLFVSATDYPHHQQRTRRHQFYEKVTGGSNELVCDVTLKLRYFYREELKNLLEQAGFEVVNLYGSYDFDEYTAHAPRLIYFCR